MTRRGEHGAQIPRPPFPFIVGCGRSGTTLLRAMLDSHPDLAIPAETKFIATMGALRRRYEDGDGLRIEPFLRDLYRYTDLEARWGLPAEEVRGALAARPPRDYPDAVRAVFALMARRAGKPRYGNKTPRHVMTMPLLLELFPEARFVHVIRDGRDVAMSYFDSAFGPGTIESAAIHWRAQVRAGRAAGARLGPQRYIEVHYERLVEDPEALLRSLCAFLELPFDERMLRYHERAEEVLSGIKLPRHHGSLRLPPTRGLRDWRTQLPASHVARFEALAGTLLEELGYERASATVAPGVALAAQGRALAGRLSALPYRVSRRLRRSR